jgi:hypothetical protein
MEPRKKEDAPNDLMAGLLRLRERFGKDAKMLAHVNATIDALENIGKPESKSSVPDPEGPLSDKPTLNN